MKQIANQITCNWKPQVPKGLSMTGKDKCKGAVYKQCHFNVTTFLQKDIFIAVKVENP